MCEGPVGRLKYLGWGQFKLGKKLLFKKTKVGLIAGGSGLTPMYAIALASFLLDDGLDIKFLYSNKTKDDIMCQDLLETLAAKNPNNFKLFHTLTRHSAQKHGQWQGLTGRITYDMLKQCGFPLPADDGLILVCGPKGLHKTVESICASNGYVKG